MAAADRHTRRDFLQGRAAARAVADAVGESSLAWKDSSAPEPSPPNTAGPPSAMDQGRLLMTLRRRAMACDFEVQLAAGCDVAHTDAALAALDLLEELEAQMTVYRGDSEVIRINRQAAERPVPLERRLFALFQLAERLHRATGGAFDITSGPLSDIWGFSRRQGRLPSDAEVAAALARVGMGQVLLDDVNHTVGFQRPGVSLHLNSIGKGYALDRLAELLQDRGVENLLLHGGRSSVLARGCSPDADAHTASGSDARGGWTVGLPHPLKPGERLAEIHLTDQALGTSGSGTQFFLHEGRRYGHLLDPRTGRPASGVYSATVVAPTAAEADALATAFYIMGPDAVGRFCATRPEIAAVLVCPVERGNAVEMIVFGSKDRRWLRPVERDARQPGSS